MKKERDPWDAPESRAHERELTGQRDAPPPLAADDAPEDEEDCGFPSSPFSVLFHGPTIAHGAIMLFLVLLLPFCIAAIYFSRSFIPVVLIAFIVMILSMMWKEAKRVQRQIEPDAAEEDDEPHAQRQEEGEGFFIPTHSLIIEQPRDHADWIIEPEHDTPTETDPSSPEETIY